MSPAKKSENTNNKNDNIDLGKRIRQLRLGKGLKIVDVSNLTGLTSSMISQVEHSSISPSVETLKKIGNALDVPVSHFFEPHIGKSEEPQQREEPQPQQSVFEVCPVVREHERKILSPGAGITYYLLNPNLSGALEFIYNIYEPNTGTGDGLYSHPGSECGLILEGELEVQIEEKVYVLKKGDSITFDSSRPHSKRNVRDLPCICVWANTPPWF